MYSFSPSEIAVLRACRLEPMTIDELAHQLQRTEPRVAQLLKQLQSAQLVKALTEKLGRRTLYVARPEADAIIALAEQPRA